MIEARSRMMAVKVVRCCWIGSVWKEDLRGFADGSAVSDVRNRMYHDGSRKNAVEH